MLVEGGKSSHICEKRPCQSQTTDIEQNNRVWELRLTSIKRNLKWRFIPTVEKKRHKKLMRKTPEQQQPQDETRKERNK